jgi:sporulation protein YlmC with PRC-barrel domain
MKRSTLTGSVATCLYLGLAAPLLAAQPAPTSAVTHPSPADKAFAAAKPARECLRDLLAFDTQMQKDGYWLGGSGFGYGYPMDGLSSGYGPPVMGGPAMMGGHPMMDGRPEATSAGYQNARPGYEVRVLLASANILAQRGQQQPCESVLATTREVYKIYAANMHNSGVHMADVPGWRREQIAAAQPVTAKDASYRSDELVGSDVRTPQDEVIGSVEDIVTSPQTGKIAYLVIARGGIFGIDQKYTPVPWGDFKISAHANLLVLDTTKASIKDAPQVSKDQYTTPGKFDQESQKVDAYWKANLSDKGTTGSKN